MPEQPVNKDRPTVEYWRGKPIDGMNRDELICAIDELAQLYRAAIGDNIEFYRSKRRAA